ncbi:MAG: hypothetical protein ACOY3E_17280 [Pseudomonadota bacterium]
MIADLIGELLGAALAPTGEIGEWLAAILCLAAGGFSIGFGFWFAFEGIAAAPTVLQVEIVCFFLLIAFACFWLFRRFLKAHRVSEQKR